MCSGWCSECVSFAEDARSSAHLPHSSRASAGCSSPSTACVLTSPANACCSQMDEIQKLLNKPYKWGFKSDIESEKIPKGLTEDTVRLISAKKNEPDW